MKKLIATLFAGGLAALVVVGCGPTPTSEAPTGGPRTPAASQDVKTEGKVTKADAGKITVSGKDFTVTDDAKVTIDGADKKAADLKDVKTDDKTTATVMADGAGKVKSVDVKTK